MKWIVIAVVVGATAGCVVTDNGKAPAAVGAPRFERVSWSLIGDEAAVDVVRDTLTQRCYASYLYVAYGGMSGSSMQEVACE